MYKGFSIGSIASFRAFNDRQRRKRPQRWYLLAFLGIICITVLAVMSKKLTMKSAGKMNKSLFGTNPCDLFGTKMCSDSFFSQPPPTRPLSDDELATRVLAQAVLSGPRRFFGTARPKIAFMFLTPGDLPFEKLWEKFFEVCQASFSLRFHMSNLHFFLRFLAKWRD